MFTGDESLSSVLRLASAIELFVHAKEYAHHCILGEVHADPQAKLAAQSYFVVMMSEEAGDVYAKTKDRIEAIQHEARPTCREGRWSAMIHILALATVTQHAIWSLYPDCNMALRPLLHQMVKPLRCSNPRPVLHILWSRNGNLDNKAGVMCIPNHFVAVLEDPFLDDIPWEDLDENTCIMLQSQEADQSIETNSSTDIPHTDQPKKSKPDPQTEKSAESDPQTEQPEPHKQSSLSTTHKQSSLSPTHKQRSLYSLTHQQSSLNPTHKQRLMKQRCLSLTKARR